MSNAAAQFFSEIFSKGMGWLGSVIAIAVFCGFLYVIGQTGVTMRRGIDLFKWLVLAKKEAQYKGEPIDVKKYSRLQKKAGWMTVLPLFFWMFVYGGIFTLCPLSFALWSLLLLVAPILGFFGVFFVPNINPFD